MNTQVHLVCLAEPLIGSPVVVAECDEYLDDFEICFLWDEQSMGAQPDFSLARICKQCILKMGEYSEKGEAEPRYLYGIRQRPQTEPELGEGLSLC